MYKHLIIVFIGFFLFGCVHEYYKKQDVVIKKIAVLPFQNFTSDEYAGEKIRSLVITELLLRGIDVVEPGEVTRRLKELNTPLYSLGISQIQNIGETLQVDAVMIGNVEKFDIVRGASFTYPEVTVNMRLIDPKSGNIIWSVRTTSGGPTLSMRYFGTEPPSLSETARKTVKDAVNTLFK
ncbi:MAG: hypothetical protein QXL51_03040 [Candidatus Aenigmatarchaeota archaeon]